MSAELAQAHILGQQRLRALVARAVTATWAGLPGYDERDAEVFIDRVVPIVLAAQRQSVALTEGYLARALERQPLGVNPDELIGAAVRNGTEPEEEWRRPFVTVWTALSRGTPYEAAVGAGLARAESLAATDVQLSMRSTASLVGREDPRIHGYQRVTDGKACSLCQIASTQRYRTEHLMPIHAHCGCSVAPLTSPSDSIINRDLYRQLKSDGAMDRITAQRQVQGFRDRAAANRQRAEEWRGELATETDPVRRARLQQRADRYDRRAASQDVEARTLAERRAAGSGVTAEVVEHGEIGPVLVNAEHHFDRL